MELALVFGSNTRRSRHAVGGPALKTSGKGQSEWIHNYTVFQDLAINWVKEKMVLQSFDVAKLCTWFFRWKNSLGQKHRCILFISQYSASKITNLLVHGTSGVSKELLK
jgi:hypothetical protein